MITLLLLIISLFVSIHSKSLEVHQIGDRKYVEIEAVHIIDSPLGIQVVHAVVPLSTNNIRDDLESEGVWYIPEQDTFPKLAYLTSHGWHFLSPDDFSKIKKRSFARRAPKDAQLDVTSLLRLAPSSFDNVQFIQKGTLGAYIYNQADERKVKISKVQSSQQAPSTHHSDAQIIKSGNLAAYVYSEVQNAQPATVNDNESLFWLIPAIQQSTTSNPYTTRLSDSSLLLCNGMPRLIKLTTN